MNRHFKSLAVVLFAALPLATGCNDGATAPGGPIGTAQDPALTAKQDKTSGAAGDARYHHRYAAYYRVRLEPIGGTASHGTVFIKIAGGYLTVTLFARGLDPLQHIPQHIHTNPTCADGGTVLINLDSHLTVSGEAPSVSDAFPVANRYGVVTYRARRSLRDLMKAVNTYGGTSFKRVGELVTWLDLENRNVHMHSSASPYTPVTCGEVERPH